MVDIRAGRHRVSTRVHNALLYDTQRAEASASDTGQFADATGDFACLVFVSFCLFIDVFLRVYSNIYYTSDSVTCIISYVHIA